MGLEGRRFANLEEIHEGSQEALDTVTKDDYRKCFQERNKCWDKCITSHEELERYY